MSIDNILKSAHIHLDYAVYRVYVKDSSLVDVKMMNNDDDKPKFVNNVSRSRDKSRNNCSILVDVSGDFDMEEFANWINSYI